MSCKHPQALIDGYVDGELDLVRSLETEHHLQECAICSQAYENLQVLRNAIKGSSPYFKSPANLQKRIRSAVRKARKAESAPHPLPWRWIMIATSLAFVVIMAWGVIHFWPIPSSDDLLTQEVISSHVRSLMADHLADVSSSDQHTVKPWFDGKLDFSPPVADLTKQGFPLVGGRLDYIGNRPVAALVYQRRQHFINLFVSLSTNNSDSRNKMMTRQGYNLIHWNKSGMSYWAVSDLNLTELQEFAQAL